jgi:SpoVK/Ycf46/Vps4 family AAA+-type ATPase/intein/homing endonuclease
MGTKEFTHDFLALLRTRTALIYIASNEEARLLEYIQSIAMDRGYEVMEWDCVKLLKKSNSIEKIEIPPGFDLKYPEGILGYLIDQLEKKSKKKENSNGVIYVLCDFYRFLNPERCNPQIERQLKIINKLITNCHVVLTGPNYINNVALEKEIAILDFPFPNEQEIKEILQDFVETDKIKASFPDIEDIINNNEEEIVNSVKGLTTLEARQAYYKSIVMANQLKIKPFDINMILQEKKQIIRKTDILEYIDTKISIDDVGGLDGLVHWLNVRKSAFGKDAVDYGLKTPKGVLLLGVPGGGKSLTSKAAASLYKMPLLRLDFGRLFNSLVGESEKIARNVIKMAETIAPCVSGDSIIHDDIGRSFKIKDLLKHEKETENFYVYSFNESTNKLEKTKVKAVIKHADKKSMLRITSTAGSVDVTKDHKMMVYRDGAMSWVEAKNLNTNDFLVMPKKMHRSTKSISFDKKGLSQMIDISSLSTLLHIATISGMIDANGFCDQKSGEILYTNYSKSNCHIFASLLSETFLIEPEIIESNTVRLKDKSIAAAVSLFLSNLGSQKEEVVANYLSGYFTSGGDIGFINGNKPFVSLYIPTEGVFDRLRKALLIFGICPIKSLKSCILLDPINIEEFFSIVPMFNKNIANKIEKFMDIIISNLENSANDNNIDSLDFSAKKIIKSTASRVSEKDINCVRITQIQSIGEQWAYDLSCEKNHNFFANGFLCHNCILWADEIEKGLSGAMGAGSGDSGTTKRVIGTFLTWLQEKTAPVFVICTANNVHDIPPEFMRAGRFDEVFFIDLPTKEGRKQIFEVLLRKIKYNSKAFDIEELATLTEGFSGAEIEKLIENTMFECFCDNKRDITHADLVFGCRDISPLSKTRDKEFLAMREWAKGRCKMANTANKQEVFIQKNKNQSLDL